MAKTARPSVSVLSNRADLLSGGDALVQVNVPKALADKPLRLVLQRGKRKPRNLSHAFNGTSGTKRVALVTGLPLGRSLLKVRIGGRTSPSAVVINHPNGGPVIAGPQLQPWTCQPTAKDAQCNQPPTYRYVYASTDSNKPDLQPYNPQSPPDDVATTTTDEGVKVPFIVRVETGYQDRDQYKIATLFQPGKPWTATQPQEQFNRKLVVTHGYGCGASYKVGSAPDVYGAATLGIPGVDTLVKAFSGDVGKEALGRGFAVMSTALNNNSHNCNIALQAESLLMAKEHLIETYGPLRYTIASGCSGGSVTQQQVANAYPGIYQGLTPQCSYPDTFSPGAQFADLHMLRLYFENSGKWGPGISWLPTQFGVVEGHLTHLNAITADEGLFKSAVFPTYACSGLSNEQRYNPQTNPGGPRCSVLDTMINVLGPRPKEVWSATEQKIGRGFAGQPFGNAGIQYGLEALRQGEITAAQFVDLNARVGGGDIDLNPTETRIQGDPASLANAYRSGALNQANHLDEVAMINLSGPDPGLAHDFSHALWMPKRLLREHGHRRNYVMWFGHFPILGDPDWARRSLIAMDRWLARVEKDDSDKSLPRKIIDNKPSNLNDRCSQIPGLELVALPGLGKVCELDLVRTALGTPRTMAGGDDTGDVNACQLKPLTRSDYGVTFTDEQWTALQRAFPTGVCDWTKPGIGQQRTIAWQTYQDRKGRVVYGGRRLGPPPARSGGGWSSAVVPLGGLQLGGVVDLGSAARLLPATERRQHVRQRRQRVVVLGVRLVVEHPQPVERATLARRDALQGRGYAAVVEHLAVGAAGAGSEHARGTGVRAGTELTAFRDIAGAALADHETAVFAAHRLRGIARRMIAERHCAMGAVGGRHDQLATQIPVRLDGLSARSPFVAVRLKIAKKGIPCRELLRGWCDLQEPVIRVLNLQRRMGDAEVALEHHRQLVASPVAVGARPHEDVRGQRREPRGDLPHVQVVDLDDVRRASHRVADRVDVDALRRGLEEDPPGVAQQPPRRVEHQRADRQRGDRVGGVPARREDHHAGRRSRQRRVEVHQVVQERAFDVQRRAVGARQRHCCRAIDRRAGQSDREHEATLDVRRIAEPPNRLPSQQRREHQHRRAVDLRAEDLRAPPAEREAALRRPRGELQRHQRQPDRARVGDHVRGVGQQRHRAGDEADDHLRQCEHDVDRKRHQQPAPVGVRRRAVVVVRVVVSHRGECCSDGPMSLRLTSGARRASRARTYGRWPWRRRRRRTRRRGP